MQNKKTKNLFTRLWACITVFAMCLSLVTVPVLAGSEEDYSYTVNYEMKEPVLQATGAPIYVSQVSEGGYSFVDDNEPGYGKKLRLTNSSATIGKEVKIVLPHGDEFYIAKCIDIDFDGALIVEKEDKTTVKLNYGEVSVRGIYDGI